MTERGGLARRFHLVFVVAVGSGCGLVAVAFHHAIVLARSALIGAVLTRPPGAARLALILLLPAAMGAVLAVILPRVAPEAGGGLALVRRAYAA
ncbi:MAG TPA: hypothetical protein VGR00_14430, partial [Thermoanaerobaculia bacterium]|nr:hypothetical protein [Thermoanaerobaculia bacterium]